MTSPGQPSDSSLPFKFPVPSDPTAYSAGPNYGVTPTGSSAPAKRPSGAAQRVKPAIITIGVFAAVVGSTLLILTALAHQSLRGHRKPVVDAAASANTPGAA